VPGSRRLLAVTLALLMVTAGCLGGGEPLGETSGDESPSDPDGGPEDEANASDRSGSDDEDEGDAGDEQDADGNRSSSQGEQTNETGEDREGSSSGESSYPPWPSPENASIRPGVQVHTDVGQCTSNFLFRTPDNATLMLGLAAHCVADAPTFATNGCSDSVDPQAPGAEVDIEGADEPGRLVYSSWHTMQQANVTEDAVCRNNDVALVAVNPADRADVHPAVEAYGGPTGLAGGDQVAIGDRVQWYGNTGTTPSSPATNRHQGSVLSSTEWRFEAYSAAPGVPGDSGSGVMLADGSAAGVLVTVTTVYPGANGITKLDPALAFAQQVGGVQAELVTWETTASAPVG